jgi:succinyl-CoA synthetase alpha subunit
MAILIDETKRVLVQGITGREGMARTRLMLDYGTQVIAGCTPGKGGTEVFGVKVYDSVKEAKEKEGDIDISVIFVPGPLVKGAAFEALDAGIKMLVLVPDRVPIWDVMEITDMASEKGARFIGPNTLGVLSPEKALLGMIGGRAESARAWFTLGCVGVSSRSGGITSAISYHLTKAGIGQSTAIHVGGDVILGMSHADVLMEFEKDPQTKVVVMFGEIGGSQEEDAALLILEKKFTKPLVAYIGGKGAQEGTRFSHAGAIIEQDKGRYETKIALLKEAGAHVVERFEDIPKVTKEVLNTLK